MKSMYIRQPFRGRGQPSWLPAFRLKYMKQSGKNCRRRCLARSMLMNSQASKQQTEMIMRTYTNNLMTANGLMVGTAFAPRYTVRKAKGAARIGKRAKNVALFFAAPFVGLAYLLAFPVVGFALLLWMVAKAVMNNAKARPVALALAAPVIGLAFVTVGPIVGLGALAWFGARALLKV